MTNLSPMWVKKVTPMDDGFIPYVAPSNYQYKPNLVPTYDVTQPYTFDTPRTARGVTLGIKERQRQSRPVKKKVTNTGRNTNKKSAYLPMGPDIPYRDHKYNSGTHPKSSLPLGPDIRYRDYAEKSNGSKNFKSKGNKGRSSLPMGPDIPYRDYTYNSGQSTKGIIAAPPPLPMGPDIRYRETKYVSPSDRLSATSSAPMGPDIPYRDYFRKPDSNNQRKRIIKPQKPTTKKTKIKRNVQIREDPVAYKGYDWSSDASAAAADPTTAGVAPVTAEPNDDWKRPYEQAGEAAVLSWIRMQEESKRRGNRYHGYAFSRYDIEDNPTGAAGSIRRTYDFHGADF